MSETSVSGFQAPLRYSNIQLFKLTSNALCFRRHVSSQRAVVLLKNVPSVAVVLFVLCFAAEQLDSVGSIAANR
jgi:hypothetical protein